ncbi:MAG: efflux RND transporter periplasmic adaptor subunit [Gammaproteobacteria bacterium]|nr:efflux RND transporter periplasmic adaptor subunit [Gammaproteobacteria bacterium]
MKTKIALIGLLLAIAAGVITLTTIGNAQPAPQGPPPAPVRVDNASKQEMSSTLWAPGTVVSRNDANIAAEVNGRLSSMVEVGDYVRKGDVIAQIDDRFLQLQLRENEANIAQLEANLKYTEQQLERQQTLSAQNIASKTQYDEALSQRDIARQQLLQARVTREQTLFQLERSKVIAPFSGKIVARLSQPGEFISVGGELVRLVDIENIEIRAQAPLSITPYIYDGLNVTVKDRGREIISAIRAVIPVGDERSRMMEVRVNVGENSWAIGTPVRVALPQSSPREVIAVHRDALILREHAAFLYRVKDDGTVEQVTVEPGIENGIFVEVKGQISPGDQVVVRGGERLRPGQQVTILADAT